MIYNAYTLTELDEQVMRLSDDIIEVFCCQVQYLQSITAAAAAGARRWCESQQHGNHQG